MPEPEEPAPDWVAAATGWAGAETGWAAAETGWVAAAAGGLAAETDWPVVDWVLAGLEWLVLDWAVVGFELPATDWVAGVAWADEPVPEGLVGAFEEALPDWELAVDGEALTLVEPEPAVVEPELPASVRDVVLDAVLTAEPTTGLAAELVVDTGESAEDGADPEGGGGFVAACACRENTSMITKIPAATIASCTAR